MLNQVHKMMARQKKKLRYSEETLWFPKYYIGWIRLDNCGQKTSTLHWILVTGQGFVKMQLCLMAYPWYYLLFKLVTDYSLESRQNRLVLRFLFRVCKIMINHTTYFHLDFVWSLNPDHSCKHTYLIKVIFILFWKPVYVYPGRTGSAVVLLRSFRVNRRSDLYSILKVSKPQRQFFFDLDCPKNEQNIRQNSAL